MIGDAQQYDELTQLYSTFGDAELLSLAHDFDDLTESAQQVLTAELSKRRLSRPAPAAAPADDSLQDATAESPLQAFAALAPAECVFEFAEISEARAAQSALAAAGIESVIPNSPSGSLRGPRIVVAPNDALTAELILSRPLPTDTTADEETFFVDPSCPACGAPDALLESVDPTNHWHCEACDHRWADPLPAEEPA